MGPCCWPVRMRGIWAVPAGLTRSPGTMPRIWLRAEVGRPVSAGASPRTRGGGGEVGDFGDVGDVGDDEVGGRHGGEFGDEGLVLAGEVGDRGHAGGHAGFV